MSSVPLSKCAELVAGSGSHVGPSLKMKDEGESELRNFFVKRSSRGLKPSLAEMIEFCRKRGIRWNRRRLRSLKNEYMFTAIFSHPRRPLKFQTAAIKRYGVVQVRIAC